MNATRRDTVWYTKINALVLVQAAFRMRLFAIHAAVFVFIAPSAARDFPLGALIWQSVRHRADGEKSKYERTNECSLHSFSPASRATYGSWMVKASQMAV